MDILNALMFYILCAVILVAVVGSVFSRCTIHSAAFAIVVFWAVGGLYFLLDAQYLGTIQILLWGVGVGILLVFAIMLTNRVQDDKTAVAMRPVTFLAPVFCVFFAVLILPFILNFLGKFEVLQKIDLITMSIGLFKEAAVGFELVGILLFAALVGIGSILLSKKVKK